MPVLPQRDFLQDVPAAERLLEVSAVALRKKNHRSGLLFDFATMPHGTATHSQCLPSRPPRRVPSRRRLLGDADRSVEPRRRWRTSDVRQGFRAVCVVTVMRDRLQTQHSVGKRRSDESSARDSARRHSSISTRNNTRFCAWQLPGDRTQRPCARKEEWRIPG